VGASAAIEMHIEVSDLLVTVKEITMVIGDWDTKENLQYKERLMALSDEGRAVLDTIDNDTERADFLRMTDMTLDWNRRYQAGARLSTATLQAMGTHQYYNSIANVILKERGL